MASVGVKPKRNALIATELVLLMPLLLILVFGVIEYGWMFLKASEIADAARRGARYAATIDVTSAAQITDAAYSPTPPSIVLLEQAGIPVSAGTVTVPTGVTPGAGNPVTVTVEVPYDEVELLGVSLLPTPEVLRASVSMAKEGY